MGNIVLLENVCLRRNRQDILTNINLTVKEKQFVGILGPNGGGKTTLLKVILGLVKPDSGRVEILGGEPEKVRHNIGYVPQQTDIDKDFPVLVKDVVLMGRLCKHKLFKKFSAKDIDLAEQALDKVEMKHSENKVFGVLSGGERQRVLIARALASEPKLLLLDEPTSSVDPKIKTGMFALLDKLRDEMAMILVTHDVGTAASQVDAIACLNKELFFHESNEHLQESMEKVYQCPVDVIAHGIPHRVLKKH